MHFTVQKIIWNVIFVFCEYKLNWYFKKMLKVSYFTLRYLVFMYFDCLYSIKLFLLCAVIFQLQYASIRCICIYKSAQFIHMIDFPSYPGVSNTAKLAMRETSMAAKFADACLLNLLLFLQVILDLFYWFGFGMT